MRPPFPFKQKRSIGSKQQKRCEFMKILSIRVNFIIEMSKICIENDHIDVFNRSRYNFN